MKKYGLIFGMLEADTEKLKGEIKKCLDAIGCTDNLLITELDSKMSYLYIRFQSTEEDIATIVAFFKVELDAFLVVSFVIANDEATEQKIQLGSIGETELSYLIKKVLNLRNKAGETFKSII